MALVGLSVISIFKCNCHYKSRDIGDDDEQITVNYSELSFPLGEFMFVVLSKYIPCSKLTNYFISTKHASDCCCNWSSLARVTSNHSS